MVFDVSGERFPLVIGTLSDEILNSNLAFDTISTNAFPMGCGAIFMNLQESTAAVTIYFVQYSHDGPFQIPLVCFLDLAHI